MSQKVAINEKMENQVTKKLKIVKKKKVSNSKVTIYSIFYINEMIEG